MRVEQVNKTIYTQKYLEDREIFWNVKIKEYKDNNIPLWNGSVYYLDKMLGDNITIGLCEYKDLIFLGTNSAKEIQKKYDIDFNFLYINIQILLSDGSGVFLFGTKSKNGYIEIITVGGTLRLENGNIIKKFEDIVEYAKNEISVETKIKIETNKLKYLSMIVNNNICTFLFEYHLDFLDEKILNMGEFDGVVCLKKEDIFAGNKFRANKRLESIKDYLEKLWQTKKQ